MDWTKAWTLVELYTKLPSVPNTDTLMAAVHIELSELDDEAVAIVEEWNARPKEVVEKPIEYTMGEGGDPYAGNEPKPMPTKVGPPGTRRYPSGEPVPYPPPEGEKPAEEVEPGSAYPPDIREPEVAPIPTYSPEEIAPIPTPKPEDIKPIPAMEEAAPQEEKEKPNGP